jgi:uncharacterized protein YaaR (DUF327 family)
VKVKPISTKVVTQVSQNSARVTDPRQSFGNILKGSVADQQKQVCSQLMEQIDLQSQELKKSFTPEGIRQYIKLVQFFMKETMKETYAIDEDTHWDASGNRKNFIIVKKVNQALEDLMDSVVNQEKPRIDLVAKLDEIRGLLLDLYI